LGDLVQTVLPRTNGGHTSTETHLAHNQGTEPSAQRQ
jgi:hypothetical protein